MSTLFHEATWESATETKTDLRPAYIAGLGRATPARLVSNEEVALRLNDCTADSIESRTGIRTRFFALPDENTSDLATAACHTALEQGSCSPNDVDMILLATATPDHLMPATACRVQHLLGATRAAAIDLSAACSGFVYAMWIGQQFIQSGQAHCVLVVGAEIMSRIVDPTDRQCAMLFGDGAGAAVLTASEGPYRLGRFWAKTYGDQYPHLLRSGGTDSTAASAKPGPNAHYLQMDGRRVFRAAVAGFCEAIEQAAAINDLTLSEIDWIVPHQANVRIFAEVAARLGVSLDLFWHNIETHGNTVAASVPLALEELHRVRSPISGSKLILGCVGAGMTAGGTALFVD